MTVAHDPPIDEALPVGSPPSPADATDSGDALPRSARSRPSRGLRLTVLPLLALALLASCVVSVGLGSFPVAPATVLDVVWSRATGGAGSASQIETTVVWQLRLPRVLTGALVGAALAAAGAALQAVVRNSLADPYLIGVSSGASLGAAAVLTLGASAVLGAVTLAAGAFVGALLAIVMVLGLARGAARLDSARLVLAGLTVSYFLAAATNLLVVLSDRRDAVRAVLFWTLGSLGRSSWTSVLLVALGTLVTVLALLGWARRLDAIAIGDDVARSLGTEPSRFRAQVVVVGSFGIATAVAVAGSIGFVGLVVPHLARRLVGATHRLVVPTSALLGGLLLVWADALARTVLSPREIPLGVLTALVGTPVLMVLVRRQFRHRTPGES